MILFKQKRKQFFFKLFEINLILFYFGLTYCLNIPTIVPLGKNCAPALILQKYKLRLSSYPFDWLVTSYASIYDCLLNDFNNFMKKENLVKQGRAVRDIGNNITFWHDFPRENNLLVPNFIDFYQEIKEKYDRRIKRLLELLNSSKEIIFFATYLKSHQAQSIQELLYKKFPQLKFNMVVINTKKSKKWNLPNIRNYFIPHSEYWNYKSKQWKNILLKTFANNEEIKNYVIEKHLCIDKQSMDFDRSYFKNYKFYKKEKV